MNETLIFALLALLFNGLFIIGLHRITRDGYLFGWVERGWRQDNPDWVEWDIAGDDITAKAEYIWREHLSKEPERWLIPWIANPISECPTCMASLWGAAGFSAFFLWWIPLSWAWAVVPYCIALAGLIWIGRRLWEEDE